MRCLLLLAALAALLACASANNHVCNSGWQDLIEPSANGQTYGNPHGALASAAAWCTAICPSLDARLPQHMLIPHSRLPPPVQPMPCLRPP